MTHRGRTDQRVQEGARDRDGREHADEDTKCQRQREALDQAGAELITEPVEDEAGNQRRHVAVTN